MSLVKKVTPAVYNVSLDEKDHGNPFIEALPRSLSNQEVMQNLSRFLLHTPAVRALPHEHRYFLTYQLENVFIPLDRHLLLEKRFAACLRESYSNRNPFQFRMHTGYNAGFTLIGPPASGKSSSLDKVLVLYPQVIAHTEYQGLPFEARQLVWLKVDLPEYASLDHLCLDVISQIDQLTGSSYWDELGRCDPGDICFRLQSILETNCLGVLIVDNIHNLLAGNIHDANGLLNWLISLTKSKGISVIMLGNEEAYTILQRDFVTSNWAMGTKGPISWKPLQEDDIWSYYAEQMWRYQYTSEEYPLSEDIKRLFYQASQGLAGKALEIYGRSQRKAIIEGKPLDLELIREAIHFEETLPPWPQPEVVIREGHIASLLIAMGINPQRALEAVKAVREVEDWHEATIQAYQWAIRDSDELLASDQGLEGNTEYH